MVLFFLVFLFFLLQKSELISKSPTATLPPTPQLAYVMWSLPQLVQLMNVVSNLIFDCNKLDANRLFVTFRESTAAAPSSDLLNAKFTFKRRLPPIIFARIVKPVNALQLCR